MIGYPKDRFSHDAAQTSSTICKMVQFVIARKLVLILPNRVNKAQMPIDISISFPFFFYQLLPKCKFEMVNTICVQHKGEYFEKLCRSPD